VPNGIWDAFVVMPNHVRGTIIITSRNPVQAGPEPAPTEPTSTKPAFTEPASMGHAPTELPFARRAARVSLMKLRTFGENTEWCHAPESGRSYRSMDRAGPT
jgi:hypothetical protein